MLAASEKGFSFLLAASPAACRLPLSLSPPTTSCVLIVLLEIIPTQTSSILCSVVHVRKSIVLIQDSLTKKLFENPSDFFAKKWKNGRVIST